MSPRLRILLLGANGQIGFELARALASLGCVQAASRQELDLADAGRLRAFLRAKAPNLIVNAAAYTAVDRAESEPEMAMQINGVAPAVIAEEARSLGAAVVHYSTDYVFDGQLARPYSEQDLPKPMNAYGRSKLAGDEALTAARVPHLIFRTSWVYGIRGKNFLLAMLRFGKERAELRVVNDQVGAPTFSRMIALATAAALAQVRPRAVGDWGVLTERQGVYNLSAAGETSWYGFAQAIFELAPPPRPHVQAIASREYPQAARRPAWSVLNNAKLGAVFGLQLPDWQETLAHVMAELNENAGAARNGAVARTQ